ncbi:phosphotransferase [Streptomyces cyaneofuscatus]|uniref:Aminoglycoside phosphotransferase n=1 Tax=Streptomyces cyaneofuscatus TaxID=66883 RepID=A0ABZ1ENY4_9ACTN|nr:phosphotransferase [Streptomyces cyaneofuscatus]WSB05831.1 aminoglycoside phosphotransferase [Streptomyces cyaneofuscatus]WSD50635.1 aminoglycoside phosphotransferase [Streptomyces cyaneofuscatus]
MPEQPSAILPPRSVLDAFGVRGIREPLTGGQGRSVRVGGAVLKPAERTEGESEWAASVFERLPRGAGFRVPRPLRSAEGDAVVEGWTAAEFIDGRPGPSRQWPGVVAVGRAFHAALREVPRPAFLDRRTHPWAVADRVAWGEEGAAVVPELAEPFAHLLSLRRPVEGAAQVIHGDLTGNVLFSPGQDPVVIDFSPYWRPPLYAEAVVIVDGLLWYEPAPSLLVGGGGDPRWRQMLIRALIFRLVALSGLVDPSWRAGEKEAARFLAATEAVERGTYEGRGRP